MRYLRKCYTEFRKDILTYIHSFIVGNAVNGYFIYKDFTETPVTHPITWELIGWFAFANFIVFACMFLTEGLYVDDENKTAH